MAGIKKETQYSQTINIVNNIIQQVVFGNYHPQVFQIRNFGNDILYVASYNNISASKFEMSIVAGGTRVFTFPQGLQMLYLFSASSMQVQVNSWEATDLLPSDLDQTQISAIVQNVASDNVNIVGSLPAGTNHLGTVTLDNANISVTTQSQVEVTNDVGNPMPMSSVDLGLKADSKATDSASSWSVIALLKGIIAQLLGGIVLSGGELRPSTAVTIQNVLCVNANQEYSITLPQYTRRFSVTNAEYDSTNFTSVYYTSGASTVLKVRGDSSYNEADLRLSNPTPIYFKTSVANRTIQVVSWLG